MSPWTAILGSLAGCLCWLAAQGDASRKGEPTPSDIDAVAFFWETFQHHPGRRDEAIERLSARALAPDCTPKEVLFVGLAHLWAVAEGGGAPARLHSHAVLAEHWLARAAKLDPDDARIAGWQASASMAIADLLHDETGRSAALARVAELAAQDPCFHSVPFGIATFGLPRADPRFRQALQAMNAAFDCGERPVGQDHPRWPHNVAGFLLALADFRLKAGDVDGAELALVVAEARETTANWPYRGLLDDRLSTLRQRAAKFADDDPANDPPFALQGGVLSCSACHAGATTAKPAGR
jgi:hypothetical protein